MKKLFSLLLTAFIISLASAQQTVLLLTETFDGSTNQMLFDSAAVGSNSGTNNWTVNNNYNGAGVYPDTPPEDSVVSGQINGAPYSKYLHIHDTNNPNGAMNANWDTSAASDRFTYIGSPFCTLGMTDVIFTFFWICEGNANAYGELYYRIDGGAWIQTGQTKYSGQSKWKYEIVQDAAFNNVQNLQLGFRWVNSGVGNPKNISFGIDDIIAVGTYDNINNPVQVDIFYVSDQTPCQGDNIVFGWHLSQPLCDGQYFLELSDAFGNFGPNPGLNQYINIFAPDTLGYFLWTVPNNILGNCYKMRLHLQGVIDIIGLPSVCFAVSDCPETIITNNAPVMTDIDTACVLSVIDVKFNSFGVFGNNNIYTAQLSDTNGSFASPFQLGTLASSQSFPGMPGTVSGLIPGNVPAGCGYYIRIISSSPSVTGTLIGPFCLVHCDELTNNHLDLHFCIGSPTDSICKDFNIGPNYWNNQADYDTCNNWTIEIRSMMDFSLVNSGGLGVYHDSIGGIFRLCMPDPRELLPFPPGAYYMRIVSNCSNQTWNQTGSVIHFTVGAPDTIPPDILMNDTVQCDGGQISFLVNPFNHPPSEYWWNSNFLGNPAGTPFKWDYNPLYVNITPGTPLGDYTIYVRENNFGCFGPYSAAGKFTIITVPTVHITGDTTICLGDTVTYDVTYLKETYYNWDAPAGVTVLDEANSQVTMIFDSLGDFTISNFSLNKCGSDSGSYKVKVITLIGLDAGPDQTICGGDSIQLNATIDALHKTFMTDDTVSQKRQGAMFNIFAHNDVVIDSFALRFYTTAAVQAEIYGKSGTYKTFEQDQFSWNLVGSYFNFASAGSGVFTVVPIEVNQPITANDTFAFYVTTANNPAVNLAYGNGNGLQGSVYKSDGVIDFIQGTANAYPFGTFTGPKVVSIRIYYSTKAGLHYQWNTGDTTAQVHILPQQNGNYIVTVFDTSGCRNSDSVLVTLRPQPQVNAGSDTLVCKNADYQINATSSVTNVAWQPNVGLNNYNVPNPVFNYNDSVEYVLTATDSVGCKNTDSLLIRVKGPTVDAGIDTMVCVDVPYQITATASDSNSLVWNPATGLSVTNILNPVFQYHETQQYILTVSDADGCVAFDTLLITIGGCEGLIKVPQAFTPNGDGTNDHFTLFGEHITDYEIRIYNRWGELVYNSRDLTELNDLSRGWDGTYKGKLQELGTFVYYLTASDVYGNKHEKKGNITLIR